MEEKNMKVLLKPAEVFSLREHLGTRKYNVMHLRRRYSNGTLLGGLALLNDSIVGIFSFHKSYMHLTVTWLNGSPVIEVVDNFQDTKIAKLIEDRLAKYIMKRIEQEKEWDTLEQKFGPRYSDGEVYLRRRKNSDLSHVMNLRRSAESGVVAKNFAERLAGMNLILRFKPKV